MQNRWAILTGEYPPDAGGVGDYTRVLARALVEHGEEVHVFTPPGKAARIQDNCVALHVLPNHYGLSSLSHLSRELDQLGEVHVLVQYVPHAFGWRAMNLPFCRWLYRRRSQNRIATMFHEVAFPRCARQPLKHNFLAWMNRKMARLVAEASERVFVSIPAWGTILESLGVPRGRIEESPIFSNLPVRVDREKARLLRQTLVEGEGPLIGHFGPSAPSIATILDAVIPKLLEQKASRLLLIGRDSRAYAESLTNARPDNAARVICVGSLPADDVSAHLSACDLLLQPYPDGLSGRRGTVLAGMALGVPVVSNLGALSENFWESSGAVALAASPASEAIIEVARRVLDDPAEQSRLTRRGPEFYSDHFDVQRTIDRLMRFAATAER